MEAPLFEFNVQFCDIGSFESPSRLVEQGLDGGEDGGDVVGGGPPGGNCIKIDLPGKLILGDYFQENRTSRRLFLLQFLSDIMTITL